jgi:hypothetical protein
MSYLATTGTSFCHSVGRSVVSLKYLGIIVLLTTMQNSCGPSFGFMRFFIDL